MSAAVKAADGATTGKHCAQCGTWLPRDEYSKNQRKKPGNWSCTPCVENGLRAEREMDRMLAAADDNGDARQEARRKARREFRAAAAAPATAPASAPAPAPPAPGPAPRPPGLERRGVTAAPSSLTEATTASTASAPRVDPAAATFAIGRAAAEGQNAKQQLKILCDKFSASLTVAAVTDAPRGSYAFECVVDGVRRGVGTARSKKDAKERAAALALRALARAQPGAAPAVAYTDRTRAPGRRGAADLKGARGSGVLGGVANAAVEPVAAAAAPLWQRAPGPQVGPPGFL